MVIEDELGDVITLMIKFYKVALDASSQKIIKKDEISEFALYLTMQELKRRREIDGKKDSRYKKDDSR